MQHINYSITGCLPDLPVVPGSVLVVRLGGRRLHGVAVEVLESSEVPPERLVPVDEVLSELPTIPDDLRDLAAFVSTYYQEPIGLCFAQMLPPLTRGPGSGATRNSLARAYRLTAAGRAALLGLPVSQGDSSVESAGAPERGRRCRHRRSARQGAAAWRAFGTWRREGWIEPVAAAPFGEPVVSLNPEQLAAVDAVLAEPSAFHPSLLQGVTGSGKTEVYLAAAARVIAAGKQVLLLVPEINLTPQLEQRIAAALPGVRVASLHSGLGSGERRARWRAAARGEIELLVGTRLAVFAPVPRLGLIVVDEEHDGSFKQQDGVRYHARDVAIYRARLREVPIVLGSATPSLESYAQAKRGRYVRLGLRRRATEHTALPAVRLVPTRDPDNVEGISPVLRTSNCGSARATRAIVALHQPARLCAIAAVRGLRMEGDVSTLQCASGRASRRGDAALSSLRPCGDTSAGVS